MEFFNIIKPYFLLAVDFNNTSWKFNGVQTTDGSMEDRKPSVTSKRDIWGI